MFQNDADSTNLREANKAARRARILEAATQLIAEEGIDGLTMRKLGRAAGLSVQTVYNLTGGRDEILGALMVEFSLDVERRVVADAAIDDPMARVREMYRVAIDHMARHEATYRPLLLAVQAGAASGEGAVAAARITRRLIEMSAPLLDEAIARGLLRDDHGIPLEAVMLHVLAGYTFACQAWATGMIDAESFEARSLFGMDIALLGLATEAARPALEAQLAASARGYALPSATATLPAKESA